MKDQKTAQLPLQGYFLEMLRQGRESLLFNKVGVLGYENVHF